MKAPTFEDLKDEYSKLWATAVTRTSFKPAVDSSANKIIASKERYQQVAAMTNVPWFVVGLIHQMEAGCRFTCHLHNGDPLSARTVHVPKGRPAKGIPVFPWEDSACDALLMHDLNKVAEWSIERICFELERYNGWGYRWYHPTTLSPYLWSGTAHYARGKYVEDGKWSSEAVSGQSGAMALLRRIRELDPTVLPDPAPAAPVVAVDPAPAPVPPPVQETDADSFSKANEKRAPLWRKLLAWFGLGATTATQLPEDPVGTADRLISTGERAKGVSQRGHELSMWAFSLADWPYLVGGAVAACGLYWFLCHYLPSKQGTPT